MPDIKTTTQNKQTNNESQVNNINEANESYPVYQDENGIKYNKLRLFEYISCANITFGGGSIGSGVGVFIGSGKRAEVIRALGFSDHPTKEECASKMTTITLEGYPNKRITVHQALVNEVQAIFKTLRTFNVNIKLLGGFCYRPINNPSQPGSKTLSMHSFGCAIDINWDINPFVKHGKPLESGDDTPAGKVRTMNSPIVKAFAANGWGWGGRYGDYMHFSKANGS